MRIGRVAIVGLMSVALAGCYAQNGPKQNVGTLLGAVAGGVAGSQIGSGSGRLVATGVGTLLGAMVGSGIGQSLDRADQMYHARAYQNAMEYGTTGSRTDWHNPDSGNYGYVEPGRAYETSSGYCREYSTTIYVGGRPESGYGTACRQPDGSWKII